MGPGRSTRLVLAGLLLMTVNAVAAVAADDRPAGTATSRATTMACPAGAVPEDGMADTAGTSLESAIDCLVHWGITLGTGPGEFAPGGPTGRAQMATFLARTIAHGDNALPNNPPSTWSDVSGVHARAIDQLTEVGIITKADDGQGSSFRPSDPLQRSSMARWMVRAHEFLSGSPLTNEDTSSGRFPRDHFDDDDGHPAELFIDQIGAVGITGGVSPRVYQPDGTVSRAQMAAFLTRLLDVQVEAGIATFPELAPVGHRVGPPTGGQAPPPGGSWAFLFNRPEGPIRFDPCQTLHVRVNYDGAPPTAAKALDEALRKLVAATGTHIRIDGGTTEVADAQTRPVDEARAFYPAYGDFPPALVHWPATWSAGGTDGYGSAEGGFGGGYETQLFTGQVAIRRDAPSDHVALTRLLMHELGHMVGLAHVNDTAELMYPVLGNGRAASWAAGDRNGLWILGAGSDCIN